VIATLLGALSGLLLLAGIAFSVIGGLGLLRFPDFFSRLHAGGVTDTAGAGLVLAGLMVRSGFDLVTLKLLAILFFIFVTSPTSAHALSQAATSHGLRPWVGEDEP